MCRKYLLAVILLVSVLLNVFMLWKGIGAGENFVAFRPVLINNNARERGDLYLIDTSIMTENFIKNLELVLKHYKIHYRKESGKIYVSRELWENKDTMANMTSKAMDDTWVGNLHG